MTNPKEPHIKWHSTANPSVGQLGGSPDVSTGRHYIPPKEKLREWAHKSHEGGTAFCEKCNTYFAMYYIKRVKISAFKTGFVCLDCQKEHNFQIVK